MRSSANSAFSSESIIDLHLRRASQLAQSGKPPSPASRPVGQKATAAWRPAVDRKLEELIRLPRGWDGYRGIPVKFDTAYFALQMLESVCSADAPIPSIVPGTNGDLQIEWHTLRGDVELHVRRANSVHAWRQAENLPEDGEEIDLTVDFSPIVRWIEQLAEPVVDADAAA